MLVLFAFCQHVVSCTLVYLILLNTSISLGGFCASFCVSSACWFVHHNSMLVGVRVGLGWVGLGESVLVVCGSVVGTSEPWHKYETL